MLPRADLVRERALWNELGQAAKKHGDAVAFGYAGKWMPAA